MNKRIALLVVLILLTCMSTTVVAQETATGAAAEVGTDLPWWAWALLLFAFTLGLGVIAVIAGVGGGVLFVPIVSALFPFHFDFVRGAGLIVTLCGALSAAPRLLRNGLSSMRLGLPLVVFGSIGSIAGAMIGFALPPGVLEALLGAAILGIVVLMLLSKRSEYPNVQSPDPLARMLGIQGSYIEETTGKQVDWTVHRTPTALLTFVGIGVISGMFGLGAGWANVPALNLLLGAPIKVAVATSGFILTLNPAAAAWVYLRSGAILPLIAIPAVAGMMLGTRIGAQLLPRVKAGAIRWIVIAILGVAGLRSLIAGLAGVFS